MFVWNYKAIQKTKFGFVVSNRIFQAKAYHTIARLFTSCHATIVGHQSRIPSKTMHDSFESLAPPYKDRMLICWSYSTHVLLFPEKCRESINIWSIECSVIPFILAFYSSGRMKTKTWSLYFSPSSIGQRYVSVNSKRDHPPPGKPPGIWLFSKCPIKIPTMRASCTVKCPTSRGWNVIVSRGFLVYTRWTLFSSFIILILLEKIRWTHTLTQFLLCFRYKVQVTFKY